MIRVLHAVVPRFHLLLGLRFPVLGRAWPVPGSRSVDEALNDFTTQSNVTPTASEHLCQKQDRFQPWMRRSELPASKVELSSCKHATQAVRNPADCIGTRAVPRPLQRSCAPPSPKVQEAVAFTGSPSEQTRCPSRFGSSKSHDMPKHANYTVPRARTFQRSRQPCPQSTRTIDSARALPSSESPKSPWHRGLLRMSHRQEPNVCEP